MSRTIATVNVAADNWQDLFDLYNNVATTFLDVVTIAGNTVGDVTTGNGYVNGIFGSLTLIANTVRGGTVAAAANLTVSSNLSVTGALLGVESNAVMNGVAFSLPSGNTGERPSSPSDRMLRYNSETKVFEGRANGVWVALGGSLVNVGTLSINTTAVTLGNSTVNVQVNSSSVSVIGTVTANVFVGDGTGLTNVTATAVNLLTANIDVLTVNTSVTVGNSTVNVVANTTALRVGANVLVNTSLVSIGNSTVNAVVNSSSVTIGANVVANATVLAIGNSTVNTTVNSSTVSTGNLSLATRVTIGANVVVNTSLVSIGNSTVNAVVNSSSVTIGNSSINSTAAALPTLTLTTALAIASGGTGATTAAGITAALDAFVGDSGAGGTKGLVPAPAAASAAEGRWLHANGSWVLGAGATSVLTDGATVTPNFANGSLFTWTIGGNRTLANPTNVTVGQSGWILITQDGTGNRTCTFGSAYKFPWSVDGVLSTAAASVDALYYSVVNSSFVVCNLLKGIG